MNKVYIANMGEANGLWPRARANNTILTYDHVSLHPFWRAGDRGGYIAKAIDNVVTARGDRPTKQTAGRWYNLIEELRVTQDDIWISRQGSALWWTISKSGEIAESLLPSTNPSRDGPDIWVIEKPCLPWSDRDSQGRQLLWNALHPKSRDFLVTEATFQSVHNDRGYADYARALIAGEPLDKWHETQLFSEKAAEARQPGARLFSPKEVSAAEMTANLLSTVAQSNGQKAEKRIKAKTTTLGRGEWEQLLLRMLSEQNEVCALTGLPFGYPKESDDLQMRPSLDRIDSNGHYTPDNIQIVCRFMNRWKGADDDLLVRRLLDQLREHFRTA
jgi:hypothetical protein